MKHSFIDKTFKAVLTLILIAAVLIIPVFLTIQPPHPAAVSKDWQYRYGDSSKNADGIPLWVYDKKDDVNWKALSYLEQPPLNPGSGSVWLRTQLPDKSFEVPCIMFTTNDQLFEVYLEDKLIYKYGNIEHHNDKIAPGSPWHLIRLPEGYQSKTVYLRMHTPIERNLGFVRKFEIGSEKEHLAYLLANEIDNILLTCLFIFLGLCLIFIYMLRRSVNYEFPALGLFSISIGVWLLAETNFKQLFLYAPRFWLYVAFLSFYLMPVGFMIFVEKVFSPGNIYIRMMYKLNLLFAAVTFLLDITRLVPFIFTLQAFYVVLFLSVIIILATIAKTARSNSTETKIFVLGFAMFLLFGLYDVLGMYFRVVPWSQYIIPYGMFIFLLTMIYILGRRFAEVHDKLKLYSEDIKNKNDALNQAYDEVNESRDKLSEWNKNLEQIIQKRTASIQNLLDNAGQGFLTFGADLTIGEEFSSECRNIFNCNIAGKSFPELIYPDNLEERTFLINLLERIIEEKDELQKKIYISLLPEEVMLNDKYMHISFKTLADKDVDAPRVFMAILTDTTYKHMLENKMEQERNVLKMVVKVITNYDDFMETLKDYKEFSRFKLGSMLNSKQPLRDVLYEIYRTVHTFKGTFCLFEMSGIVKKLHTFETEISEFKDNEDSYSIDRLKAFISGKDIESWLKEDMDTLKSILGDQFSNREDTLAIEKSKLMAIEEKMLLMLPSAECRLLLPDIKKLRQKSFKEVLKGLPDYSQRLADKLGKQINPVEIQAENILVDLDMYQGFSKVLVHVFRNIIDHGLETPDERLEADKPENCNILCEIKLVDNMINLIISDDGRGFDFKRIRRKIIERGLLAEEIACSISDNEALELMIYNHISTKDDITVTSGRGLGLSAVKHETEKLGGTFAVFSENGKGTQFLFQLPYEHEADVSNLKVSSIIDPLVETAKEFLFDLLKCDNISSDKCSFNKPESILLKDFSCFVSIKGVIFGRFVITMDRRLTEKLLQNYAIEELSEDETDLYIEDILAESSNIIVGKSIKKFPGLEDLIVMEPPLAVKLSDAVIRFVDSSAWSCNIVSDFGNMTISFIVPYDSSLENNE